MDKTSKTLQLIAKYPHSPFALTATLLMQLTDIIDNLGKAFSTKQPFLISCNPDDYLLEVILPEDMPAKCCGLTIEELEDDPDGLDCITLACPNYPANVYINLG